MGCKAVQKPQMVNRLFIKKQRSLLFWAHESSDRKSKNTLETFLKSEGIIPLKIKIIGDRIATYKDCDCFTGLEYRPCQFTIPITILLYYISILII